MYASIIRGTLLDLSDTMISWKSIRSRISQCRIADSTMPRAVGSPSFSRMSISSDPLLTPIRIGTPFSVAFSTTARTRFSPPMLPGLMRSLSTPASSARSAIR